MNIIVPIRPHTISELKVLVQKINNRADVIEIWLDQLSLSSRTWCGISEILTRMVTESHRVQHDKVKLLGVCKSPDERGNFSGTSAERVAILQKFLDAGGDFVDMDVMRNDEAVIKSLPHQKLILSFHDFDGMPENLDDIFARMYFFSPSVYKFAVTTNTPTELENFLQFVKTFPVEHDTIFTTMGTFGREGREQIEKLGRSWGAFFALDEESKTAKGQKTLDEIS
ncbi:type I 3-dehydroquinate dehydratase [Candidatus Gracilibacteria bacterium]|nr:type I 3-dehydroquinate dehydratase [Candidatus Gracilibacteria bacterium]